MGLRRRLYGLLPAFRRVCSGGLFIGLSQGTGLCPFFWEAQFSPETRAQESRAQGQELGAVGVRADDSRPLYFSFPERPEAYRGAFSRYSLSAWES